MNETLVTCIKCGGDGLIGQGPEPHLKQGRIVTCDVCLGKGKITEAKRDEVNAAIHGTVTAQSAPGPAEINDDEGQVAVQDGEQVEAAPKAGFFSRIFGK